VTGGRCSSLIAKTQDFLTKNKDFEEWNRGRQRSHQYMEKAYIVDSRAEVKERTKASENTH
jgi:hypothetical protein